MKSEQMGYRELYGKPHNQSPLQRGQNCGRNKELKSQQESGEESQSEQHGMSTSSQLPIDRPAGPTKKDVARAENSAHLGMTRSASSTRSFSAQTEAS